MLLSRRSKVQPIASAWVSRGLPFHSSLLNRRRDISIFFVLARPRIGGDSKNLMLIIYEA